MAKRVTKAEREESARIIRRLVDELEVERVAGAYLLGYADGLEQRRGLSEQKPPAPRRGADREARR